MWRVHFLAAIFFYKYKFKFKLYPCLKEKMKKIFLLETDWKFRKKSKKKLSLLVEHFRILNHLLCMSKVEKSSFLCFCFIPVNFAYKLTKFFFRWVRANKITRFGEKWAKKVGDYWVYFKQNFFVSVGTNDVLINSWDIMRDENCLIFSSIYDIDIEYEFF